jgi:hypothetical protein
VGGVFVGYSPINIYEQIIRVRGKNKFKQFIYWDDNDIPQRLDINKNQDVWNRTVSDYTYYYYVN